MNACFLPILSTFAGSKFSLSESLWLDFEMYLFGIEEPTNEVPHSHIQSNSHIQSHSIKLLYSFNEF